tara:strand:+ start:754 stop:1032 length:279 start_codon:yes stop_codon:yes gene_type:complete
MRPEHIEDVLIWLHTGQWFGWSDSKNKIYANLIIHDASKDKPTEEWLNAELSRLQAKWNVDQVAKDENLASAKTKLENLGLTVDEIKEAFGI